MKVIAENVSGRPNEIPISKWLVKGTEYTVIEAVKCNPQGGLLGFKLAEIELGADELPYQYFAANRFRIPTPEKTIKEEIEELIDL